MKRELRLFVVAVASALCVCGGLAQDAKHEAQLRTVRGVVVDKSSDNPISSAVVFLKNTRTNAVRSYIADEQGNYRFSGLDPNVDYEIHAEHDDMTSSIRTVSSFDSRRDIEVTLKLSKKKSE